MADVDLWHYHEFSRPSRSLVDLAVSFEQGERKFYWLSMGLTEIISAEREWR